MEYPFRISYANEKAIDTGGVSGLPFGKLLTSEPGNILVQHRHPGVEMACLEMLGTILGLGFYYYALLSLCSAASFSVHHARCYEGDNLRNALSKREYDDEMKEIL